MRILILGTDPSFILNMMGCLWEPGTAIYVLSQRKFWEVSLSRYCRGSVHHDFDDQEGVAPALIDRINDYCAQHMIEVIIPSDYRAAHLLSTIKPRLKPGVKTFPVASTALLETLNNKWTFEQVLKENGLPYPLSYRVENFEQLKSVQMGFPCVVKPLGDASDPYFGIAEYLAAAGGRYIKRNLEDYLACGNRPGVYPMLVQEYIHGPDIDLSVLAFQGKVVAWTIQKWVTEDMLQFIESDEIVELGRRVVAATHFDGVAHFDLRLNERDNSIKFIECNPRFWGSLRASMWNGVNFPKLGLMLLEGKELPPAGISRNINYLMPGKLLSHLKKGQWSALKGVPEATKKDLLRLLADPLSFACSLFERM